MSGGPNLVVSGVLLAVAIAIGVASNLQLRRPYERRIHGVPWVAIQFAAAVIACIFIMHIVSLATGHQFTGRTPY